MNLDVSCGDFLGTHYNKVYNNTLDTAQAKESMPHKKNWGKPYSIHKKLLPLMPNFDYKIKHNKKAKWQY